MESTYAQSPQRDKKHQSKSSAMPDSISVGWRKKIHGKSKDGPPPPKSDHGDEAPPENWNDLRWHHRWRETLQGSRPETPNSVASMLTASVADEAVETSSEPSDASPPHRNSRPKLTRYASLFSNFIEQPKTSEFLEPWGEDMSIELHNYIDPLSVLQSVRAHVMKSSSRPISTQHHNGLLRIFDDYLRTRQQNTDLGLKLQNVTEEWKQAENQWAESESHYIAEIHRLQQLVTQGPIRLNKLRQGDAFNRLHYGPRADLNEEKAATNDFLPKNLQQSEVKATAARIALHHPTSPSKKMTALSKKLVLSPVHLVSEDDRQVTLFPENQRFPQSSPTHISTRSERQQFDQATAPGRTNTLRRFQSQPQLSSDQKARRHFSFEPGDDDLQALGQKLKAVQTIRQHGDCIDSCTGNPPRSPTYMLNSQPDSPVPSTTTLKVNMPKPTKIPSPVQKKGGVRRDNSSSSSQSIFNTRRDSRSSILTAFRADSQRSLQPAQRHQHCTQSQMCAKESLLISKDQLGDGQNHSALTVRKVVQNAEREPLSIRNNPSVSNMRWSESDPSACNAGLTKVANEMAQDGL